MTEPKIEPHKFNPIMFEGRPQLACWNCGYMESAAHHHNLPEPSAASDEVIKAGMAFVMDESLGDGPSVFKEAAVEPSVEQRARLLLCEYPEIPWAAGQELAKRAILAEDKEKLWQEGNANLCAKLEAAYQQRDALQAENERLNALLRDGKQKAKGKQK